jgi:methionyl-tRNA synthetase
MWQVILMAANLPTSQQIFINGFISVDGQKMSKSIGNVISPKKMVDKFGVDGTRYLLLSKGTFGSDVDVSWGKFIEKYNADLANGVGNLTARIIKLGADIEFNFENSLYKISTATKQNFRRMDLDKELKDIMMQVAKANKLIEETKPWELAKNNLTEFNKIMKKLGKELFFISQRLKPLLPETAKKIKLALETKKRTILFERIK